MEVSPSLNQHLKTLKPSATLAINQTVKDLKAQNKRVYQLGFGQSPFPVPEPVVQALRDNAHKKDYIDVQGLLALRSEIAKYHHRQHALAFDAENILIGPGSKELMFILQLVLDAELLLPTPCWVSYQPQAMILGHSVNTIETGINNDWCLQPDALDDICNQLPNKQRLLILNYPNNPTGSHCSQQILQGLAEVARRHKLLVLSDEIYTDLTFNGQHDSIARYYPEGTIVSSGLSKWCGAGGWRLGTFAFPKELRWLLDKMLVVCSETFSSVAAPIQHAAICAYSQNDTVDSYVEHTRKIMHSLTSLAAARLTEAGAEVHKAQGGFYLFPDFSGKRELLTKRGITNSAELCARLLEDTGVAGLPGSCFLRPEHELNMRLALVDFDGDAALQASYAHQGEIDAAFLNTHCRPVCEAVDRLSSWLSDRHRRVD